MNVRERVIDKLFQEAIEHNLIPDGDFSKFKSIIDKCRIEEIKKPIANHSTSLNTQFDALYPKYKIIPHPFILFNYFDYDPIARLMQTINHNTQLDGLDIINKYHTYTRPYITIEDTQREINYLISAYANDDIKGNGLIRRVPSNFNNVLIKNNIPCYPFKMTDDFWFIPPEDEHYNNNQHDYFTLDERTRLSDQQQKLMKYTPLLFDIKKRAFKSLLSFTEDKRIMHIEEILEDIYLNFNKEDLNEVISFEREIQRNQNNSVNLHEALGGINNLIILIEDIFLQIKSDIGRSIQKKVDEFSFIMNNNSDSEFIKALPILNELSSISDAYYNDKNNILSEFEQIRLKVEESAKYPKETKFPKKSKNRSKTILKIQNDLYQNEFWSKYSFYIPNNTFEIHMVYKGSDTIINKEFLDKRKKRYSFNNCFSLLYYMILLGGKFPRFAPDNSFETQLNDIINSTGSKKLINGGLKSAILKEYKNKLPIYITGEDSKKIKNRKKGKVKSDTEFDEEDHHAVYGSQNNNTNNIKDYDEEDYYGSYNSEPEEDIQNGQEIIVDNEESDENEDNEFNKKKDALPTKDNPSGRGLVNALNNELMKIAKTSYKPIVFVRGNPKNASEHENVFELIPKCEIKYKI